LCYWRFIEYVHIHVLWSKFCTLNEQEPIYQEIPISITNSKKENLHILYKKGEKEAKNCLKEYSVDFPVDLIWNFINWSFEKQQWHQKQPEKKSKKHPAPIFIKCPTCSKNAAVITIGVGNNYDIPSETKIGDICSADIPKGYPPQTFYCCVNKFKILSSEKEEENMDKSQYKIVEPEKENFSTLTIVPHRLSIFNLFQIHFKNNVRYVEIIIEDRLDKLEKEMGYFTCIDLDLFKFCGIILALAMIAFFIVYKLNTDSRLDQYSNEINILRGQIKELNSRMYQPKNVLDQNPEIDLYQVTRQIVYSIYDSFVENFAFHPLLLYYLAMFFIFVVLRILCLN